MFERIASWFRRSPPFVSEPPGDVGVLANLPPELQYLVGPAFHYGAHSFESSMFDFLDRASSAEMAELRQIAKRVKQGGHYDAVNEFLDEYSMSEHDECDNLYSLFGVMDHADLSFE